MNCHQVLSGACNEGDQCFAVGSVEGIPFTAYAAGCNIVILASNFERVQIIPGAIHGYIRISSLDCSTDTGKIAAAYGTEVCIFEPTPLIHTSCPHSLEYKWVETGRLLASSPVTALSWNLEGTRLLTGGDLLQLWHQTTASEEDRPSSTVTFEIGEDNAHKPPKEDEEAQWSCVWKCHTATPAYHLAFSPDGVLFATSGKNDRLVKIWYQNKLIISPKTNENYHQLPPELNYGFIYVAHPRAVTHLSWRKTSKYMPRGSVANMLVTSCLDNICRVWAETLLPEDDWGPGAPPANRAPRRHTTHRHKHRFMQRLKHMKTCFHIRRTAQSSKQLGQPIPTLPSTYSCHDFHNPYHANSYSAGLHFHLAASINSETDIPLVPSMKPSNTNSPVPQPTFILHWLHNKEMYFTLQAESLLRDLTKKILEETDEGPTMNGHSHPEGENNDLKRKIAHVNKAQSQDDSNSDEQPQAGSTHSHSLSNTTSINSIATDVACTHIPDSLDAKIELLLRDWHHSPDLLFSIHPMDGSFLIWVIDWLDEHHAGAFRQAQVSFSARIPSAFPLGDATTLSTMAALYHTATGNLYVRQRAAQPKPPTHSTEPATNEVSTPLASVLEEKEEAEWPSNADGSNTTLNGHQEAAKDGAANISSHTKDQDESVERSEEDILNAAPCPVVSMVTNHANGTLNLWQLTFADKSKFCTIHSIGHASRASGHRFRVNDITCHPVLPLLLTTSHHNIADPQTLPADLPSTQSSLSGSKADIKEAVILEAADTLCSELILWRVDAVGPLSKSGGVGELARVNSPHLSAFSNVAWIPTLLPSTTLGNLCNSPSACFVASDGECLRVYQAVIDARTLLAEVATSENRHKSMVDSMISISSDSSTVGDIGVGVPLHDRFKIVSQQSTARPGCVLQLDAIEDAIHDWQNTQLLHVFQEQLITGERLSPGSLQDLTANIMETSQTPPVPLMDSGLDAMVDLRRAAAFEEPFYIVVLERTPNGSTVHMWRLVIASQPDPSDEMSGSMIYVPDCALVQEDEGMDSRKNSVSAAEDNPITPQMPTSPHVLISTNKVCECSLPLPPGVEVIHAAPAAGHLSSASIYPACFAPYTVATACSDSTIRFWKCDVNKINGSLDYNWVEWEMMNKDLESTIDVPGQPLNISAAYSGRIACAYKTGRSFTRPPTSGGRNTPAAPNDERFVNLCVAVYECESTGGAEWLLEDTIPLRNVSLQRAGADTQIDLSYLYDSSFMQKKQRITQVIQTLSHEDLRPARNGDNGISSDSTKPSANLLAVPSFSTLQSLRRSITENGNTCPLTQKHLVQLDWVSKEDGSHILTVAVGSKVLLFTPVSSDLAQANMKAMKESLSNHRPMLRKASSLAVPHFVDEIRWMKLRKIDLRTADGLPPLPMQISWVRDGILVVGMDSEMHVYSQWKPESHGLLSSLHHFAYQETEDGPDRRNLRDADLRPAHSAQSARRLANSMGSIPHLSRVSSINLQLLERDTKKRKANQDQPQPMLNYMPDYGLFEASQMACPVLPQYHPKQLMELLNSGKIRWVKAILAHLVRCIGGSYNVRSSTGDDESVTKQRAWSRSRTLSVSFAAGAVSPLDNTVQLPEDVQLDYAEITSIPPLPLWTLLVADKERPGHLTSTQEAKDYNELFDGNLTVEEDLDELLMEEDGITSGKRDRRSSVPDRQGLSHFGPRQGRVLSRLLTHTHLPGLSSLDQMHLLALADTVSTCNTDFAERFAIDAARTAIAKENLQGTPQGEDISTDALDDCGLRFLLAMKHYGYLQRCLPPAQRGPLQRAGVGSHNIVWAFHSESHDALLALVPSYARGQPRWATLRELGVGWWLRSPNLLRTCVEKLARAAYKAENDPMDAALYYLAMRKKALLWGLFRSKGDEKMTQFFANNFAEERWRKAALKNAFALLGKQRFEHAAAFFLLGESLKDALEVLLTRLGDLQLAMIVARLYNSEAIIPDSLKQLLYEEILGCDSDGSNSEAERAHPDPFARSMALWQLKQHSAALATLLEASAGRLHSSRISQQSTPVHATATSTSLPHADPSVFNFYVYLRTHPLLVRQNVAQQGGGVGLLQEGEEGITRLERRLYFTTAHGHFKAGCPALALEVLSKLPSRIIDDKEFLVNGCLDEIVQIGPQDARINTGMLHWGEETTKGTDAVDKSAQQTNTKLDNFDWAAPSSTDWGAPFDSTAKSDELVLNWDDDDAKGSDRSESPMAMKLDSKTDTKDINKENLEKSPSQGSTVDIMAQQLKFIACLKILMEELSTLATGFEVDGGHLRYQLYIWLEREVEALRQFCNYSIFPSPCSGVEEGHLNLPEQEMTFHHQNSFSISERPTLHQVLLQEKLDFEAKVQRAVKRKRWLKANETLLRTLLSYCSLQGAGGGGLASVRMELVLLLQELGQEKAHQQLLSPLPFPTTLPLLSAAVACSKTVVADPVRHLQAQAHDMLQTLAELPQPSRGGPHFGTLFILRDLSVALSACIYQSLCDSDTFSIKNIQPTQDSGGMESLSKLSGMSAHGSHLMGGRHRRYSTEEPLPVTTQPSKWPGVTSLRALAARAAVDDDVPRLPVLLVESFAAVYLSLLSYALGARDAHLLYRLVALKTGNIPWAQLFGGGVKRLLRTASVTSASTMEKTDSGVGSSVWSSLRAQRARLNMRILGTTPPAPSIKEGRPTYREQFVPPVLSMVSYLLIKPSPQDDPENCDYDSAESVASDPEDSGSEPEDEDVFDTGSTLTGAGATSSSAADKRKRKENLEHADPDSYSWLIMRAAILRISQNKLQEFLQTAGVEMQELATASPLVHGALRRMAVWQNALMEILSQRAAPPDFIPALFAEPSNGPPRDKYRRLLDKHNTPFSHASAAAPAGRLWTYLVHQEPVEDIFIRAIFLKPRASCGHYDETKDAPSEIGTESQISHLHTNLSHSHMNSSEGDLIHPVRIIHKEQDSISAFCLNQATNNSGSALLAVATPREVQEMDISLLLRGAACWTEDECELDLLALSSDPASLPDTGFLVIQNSHDRHQLSTSPTGASPPIPSTPQPPTGIASQTGRGASVVLKHKIDNIKRMSAHPLMSSYITGGQDGSVQMWEWGHAQAVWSPRPPGTYAKVTRLRFSEHGNKFGVADGDGNLSLWQVGPASAAGRPFFTQQCHNKGISDFVFLGSCSLIATVGHSSESKNVAIWDSLMPQKQCLIVAWSCHETGATCCAWAGGVGALVSGGRRGDCCAWDVRQRVARHRWQAHDAAVRAIALAPRQDCFATGAADGDIKVWSISGNTLLHWFVGEHARSSFFKHIGQGVVQLHMDSANRLFSCGADGTMKVRKLPEKEPSTAHHSHHPSGHH